MINNKKCEDKKESLNDIMNHYIQKEKNIDINREDIASKLAELLYEKYLSEDFEIPYTNRICPLQSAKKCLKHTIKKYILKLKKLMYFKKLKAIIKNNWKAVLTFICKETFKIGMKEVLVLVKEILSKGNNYEKEVHSNVNSEPILALFYWENVMM